MQTCPVGSLAASLGAGRWSRDDCLRANAPGRGPGRVRGRRGGAGGGAAGRRGRRRRRRARRARAPAGGRRARAPGGRGEQPRGARGAQQLQMLRVQAGAPAARVRAWPHTRPRRPSAPAPRCQGREHAVHRVLRYLRAALHGTSPRECARMSGPARRRTSAAVGRQRRAQRAGTEGRAGRRGAAQTRCQEGTPLVLCDGCPLAFHLACLDVAWRDLPEAEWTCPKARRRRCRAARPRGAALGLAHASCMGPAASCPLHLAGCRALPGLRPVARVSCERLRGAVRQCVVRQQLAVRRLVEQEERRRGASERCAPALAPARAPCCWRAPLARSRSSAAPRAPAAQRVARRA